MRPILVTTVLAITMSLGLAAGVADTQCTTIIPVPATASDIACITSNVPSDRCATVIPPDVCMQLTVNALNQGLVTLDGYNWLVAFGWCPILIDLGTGPRIFQFCPLH